MSDNGIGGSRRHLRAKQKYALFMWVAANQERCATQDLDILAAAATDALGYTVGPWTIKGAIRAAGIARASGVGHNRGLTGVAAMSALNSVRARLDALEVAVARLTRG